MAWATRLVNWLAPTPPARERVPPPALSASAALPPAADSAGGDTRPGEADWQEAAWSYYRACGEARRAVDWIAHGVSRCHLYVGRIDESGVSDPEPVDDAGAAGEILAELHDGPVGQAEMLQRLAVHLLVPGESWLIGYPAPAEQGEGGDEQRTAWIVASRREWQIDDNLVRVKLPEHPDAKGREWVAFPDDRVVVVPIHRPDPEDRSRATSAFEAALTTLQELDGLDARVAADIRSRLVSGGLFEFPESATMPTPRAGTGRGWLHRNPLIAGIVEAARIAIRRPSSPEATLPIFYTVSDEAAGKGRHIPLWSEFDQAVPEMRRDARQRLASIMDIPGEIIQGIADLNHWSAWMVDEAAIKSHIGPLLTLICSNLTRKILWPALRSTGMSRKEVRSLAIWWDASEIILRPDRTRETLQAHTQGIISDRAARRELSFTEDDAPEAGDDRVPETSRQARFERNSAARARVAVQPATGGQPTPGARPEIPQTNPRTSALNQSSSVPTP